MKIFIIVAVLFMLPACEYQRMKNRTTERAARICTDNGMIPYFVNGDVVACIPVVSAPSSTGGK